MRKILALILSVTMVLSLVSMPVVMADGGVITADKDAYTDVSRGTEVVLTFSNPVTSTPVELKNAITIKKGSTDTNSNLIDMKLSADATQLTLNFANCMLASNTTYTLAATGIKYAGGTFADFSTTVITGTMPEVLINDNSDAVVTGGSAYFPQSQSRMGAGQTAVRPEWVGFVNSTDITAAKNAGTLETTGIPVKMSTSNYGFEITKPSGKEQKDWTTQFTSTAIASAYADGNDTMIIGRRLGVEGNSGTYYGDQGSIYSGAPYDCNGAVAVKGSPMKGNTKSVIVDSADAFNGIVYYNWGRKGAFTKPVTTNNWNTPYEYLWWANKDFAGDKFKLDTNTGAIVNEINLMVPSSSLELFNNDGSDYIQLAGISIDNAYQGNSIFTTRARYINGKLLHYVGGTNDTSDTVEITPDVWHNIKYVINPGNSLTRNVDYYFDGEFIRTLSVTFGNNGYRGITAGFMPAVSKDSNGGGYQLDTNEANWAKELKINYDGVSAYYVDALNADFTEDQYVNFTHDNKVVFKSATQLKADDIEVTVNDPNVMPVLHWKDNDYTLEIELSGITGNSNYEVTVSGIADICGYTMDDQTVSVSTADFQSLQIIASKHAITDYIVGTSESIVLKSNLEMNITNARYAIKEEGSETVLKQATAVLSADKKTVTVTMPTDYNFDPSKSYTLTISGIKSGALTADDLVIPISIMQDAGQDYIMNYTFSGSETYSANHRGWHEGNVQNATKVTSSNVNQFVDYDCSRCTEGKAGLLGDFVANVTTLSGEGVFKYATGTTRADGIHSYSATFMDPVNAWKSKPDKTKPFVIEGDIYLENSMIAAAANESQYSRLLGYADVSTGTFTFMKEIKLGVNSEKTAVTLTKKNGSDICDLPMEKWFNLKYVIEFTSNNKGIFSVYVDGKKVFTSDEKAFQTADYQFYGVCIAQVVPPTGLAESGVLYADNVKVYQPGTTSVTYTYSDGVVTGKFSAPVSASISASNITIKDSAGSTVEDAVIGASMDSGRVLTINVDADKLSTGSTYTVDFASTVKDDYGYALGTSTFTVERVFAISLKNYSIDANYNVTVTAGNNSFNGTDITAIVAAYNADKELVIFNTVTGTVPSLGSTDIVIPIGTQLATAGELSLLTYKIMLWGTVSDMISYIEPVEQTYTQIMEHVVTP